MKILYVINFLILFGLMVFSLVADDLITLVFNGFMLMFNIIAFVTNEIKEEITK